MRIFYADKTAKSVGFCRYSGMRFWSQIIARGLSGDLRVYKRVQGVSRSDFAYKLDACKEILLHSHQI